MDCAFFMLHVLYEFQSRENRSPEIATKDGDLALLESLVDSVAKKVIRTCKDVMLSTKEYMRRNVLNLSKNVENIPPCFSSDCQRAKCPRTCLR